MTERAAIVTILLLLGTAATGVAADRHTPIAPLPLGDTLLNLPTPRVLSSGSWEIRFTHRFSEPINDGDEHSLWGLDSSSDVGIGLAWAPTRDLELSLLRTNVQDDVEVAAKYAVLQQAPSIPLSIFGAGRSRLADRARPR